MSVIYAVTALIAFITLLIFTTDYDWKKITGNPLLILVTAAIITRLIAMKLHPGFESDINCFKSWAISLYTGGLSNFYGSVDTFTDYPPGYMYILYIIGMLRSVFGLDYNGYIFGLLIRTPAIVFDILTSIFIYKLALTKLIPREAWLLALAFSLNPAIIINSSVWGQVDSVYGFLILASIYFVTKKTDLAVTTARGDNTLYGFLLFATAILVKPQAIFFSPIFLFVLYDYFEKTGFSKTSVQCVLKWALFSILLILAGILPFTNGFDFRPVINQYVQTIKSYPYATVNAYNFYGFLGANWRPVDDVLLLFSYGTWGMIFIDIIVLTSIFLLSRNRGRANKFFTAALINTLVFMFSARMHERYIFPVLALLLIAYVYKNDKKFLLLYAGFSITLFINCADILNVFANEGDYSLIKTSMPFVSMFNLLLTGFLVYSAFSCFERAQQQETEQQEVKVESIFILPTAKEVFQLESPKHPAKINGHDILLMTLLTLVYSIVAFVNLGNTSSPQTTWTAQRDDAVVVRFAKTEDISSVFYMNSARHDKNFIISTSADGVEYDTNIFIKSDSVFSWHKQDINSNARSVRIVSNDDELMLQEMVFRDNTGQIIDIQSITENGAPLFDEQELVPDENTFMNSTYFDEIYHARTGYEFANGISVYEWTHPPLGKDLIALGISVFGMTPFGWRFMGTLFGALMIPLMYCFGKKMFGSRRWAFFAAFILAFDNMHFAQTRIATIDTYVTFFIIGMFYFMYIYCNMSFYKDKLVKTLIPLGLSGLFMALAIASKWPGIYAGIGLAVLFFNSFYKRTREYVFDRRINCGKNTGMYPKYAIITLCSCVLFFVAIPLLVYCLSYIPYLKASDSNGISAIIKNQTDMFNYHAYLESEHPYSSSWWSWPFNWRPIFYYVGYISDGIRSGISSFGNPAIWWCGVVAFFYCISARSKKRDMTSLFLLIAFAAQYLPWMLVSRTTYIYHYFPSLPFIVLMIVYFFKNYVTHKNKRMPIIYAVITLVLFVMYYPVLSGMPVSIRYVEVFLRWLPTWQLI